MAIILSLLRGLNCMRNDRHRLMAIVATKQGKKSIPMASRQSKQQKQVNSPRHKTTVLRTR